MKMVVGYAKILEADDPLLLGRGLTQHARAASVWRECMLPPVRKGHGSGWDDALDPRLSERMVMYTTTRKVRRAARASCLVVGQGAPPRAALPVCRARSATPSQEAI